MLGDTVGLPTVGLATVTLLAVFVITYCVDVGEPLDIPVKAVNPLNTVMFVPLPAKSKAPPA